MITCRRTLLATPALLLATARLRAAEPLHLRLSLDTSATHVRTVSMGRFLQEIEHASGGRIRTTLFHSGQLFNDRDAIKGLLQGQLEMAVPGTWVLSGTVPEAELMQLPEFYGQPVDLTHRVIDGPVGTALNQAIERKLSVHVLGAWFDLGLYNWHATSRPITGLADLKGRKIRNSGGPGQAWRARFFGVIPNVTALPDVPLALSQGPFDGLVTSNETVVSLRLWESGLRHSFEDHQFMAEYVPMIARPFWDGLDEDLRGLMTAAWSGHIAGWRADMAAAQGKARATMEANGMFYRVAAPEALLDARQRMFAAEDKLIHEYRIPPDLVTKTRAAIA